MSRARRVSLLDDRHANRTPDVTVVAANLANGRERTVSLDHIDLIAGHNPRVRSAPGEDPFGAAALTGLVASIRTHGVLQPLLVRPHAGRYQLVAGERRLHAARQAGLRDVPVRIVDVADPDLLEYALVENLQRRAMDPVSETYAVLDLLARHTGLARDTALPAYLLRVRNGTAPDEHAVGAVLTALGGWSVETWARSRVRILAMTDAERAAVTRGAVPLGVAGELTALPDGPDRAALLRDAETAGLGVRAVRARVRALRDGAPDAEVTRAAEVRARLTPKVIAGLSPRRRVKVQKLLEQLWAALDPDAPESR